MYFFVLINCLFVLILYLNIPVNNISVMSLRVFLGWTRTKQRINCLAQGHNAVPLVRFEPAISSQAIYHKAIAFFMLINEKSANNSWHFFYIYEHDNFHAHF